MDPIWFPGKWSIQALPTSQGASGATRPEEAAQAVEAFFLSYLLKVMRESSPHGGFLGSGASSQMLQGIWDEALAQVMAERGGIGLRPWLLQALDTTPGGRDQGAEAPDR